MIHLPVFSPLAGFWQRYKTSALLLAHLTLWSGQQAEAAVSAPLTITQSTGRAELQDSGGTWQTLKSGSSIVSGLRTGTGRVTLKSAQAQVTVGSASRLRVYQQEPDFQEGQFLYEGSGGFFALGWHMNVEGGGRVRIDLLPLTGMPRVAVLQGRARLSSGNRIVWAKAGEQLALNTGQLSAFTENDPWYLAQFVGPGAATIEAFRGQVQYRSSGSSRPAKRNTVLSAGDNITTGAGAWVEIGFTGGGYLRLTEQSELSVVSIDKTATGREITLRLLKGSAWNVVEKGKGGYRITTPVVSTAVRGTTFRVDAAGTVKVFDGRVELPSSPGVTLDQGMEKRPGQNPQPLQPDALDQLNLQLDQERAQPLTLSVQPVAVAAASAGRLLHQRQLQLQISSLPDSDVTLQVGQQRFTLAETEKGFYTLPAEVSALPEGTQRVTVTARRYGQFKQRSLRVQLDHTPPVLSQLLQRQQGRVLELRGNLQDQVSQRTQLQISLPNGQTVERWLPNGPFRLVLPAVSPAGTVRVVARDASGNEDYADLP